MSRSRFTLLVFLVVGGCRDRALTHLDRSRDSSSDPIPAASTPESLGPVAESDGRLIAGWARPCAANTETNRLAYITDPVAGLIAHVSAGKLSMLRGQARQPRDSGLVADCDTVRFAPRGTSLAWKLPSETRQGAGLWRDENAAAEQILVAVAPSGGGVNQIAFSPDGRWVTMVLNTRSESTESDAVLQVGAADAPTPLVQVPLDPDDGRVTFAPDGAILFASIEGSGFRNVGTMRLYRIEPSTGAVISRLGDVVGTRDALWWGDGAPEAMSISPRMLGQALVYMARSDSPWRGTLVQSRTDGGDRRALLDGVRAFSTAFGDGRRFFAFTAPTDAWLDCCTLWEVDLESSAVTPVPDVPHAERGVIALSDGRRLLLTPYADDWGVWDRAAAQTTLTLGAWRALVWQSADGRYVLGLSGDYSGPYALELADTEARSVRTLGTSVGSTSVRVLEGGRIVFVRGLDSKWPDATGGELVLAHLGGTPDVVLARPVPPQIVVTGDGRVFYALDGAGDAVGMYSLRLPP